MRTRKWIDAGKDFIYFEPLRLEICRWRNNSLGVFIYPAIVFCKTGNSRGFKIKFLKYTIDFTYYLKK